MYTEFNESDSDDAGHALRVTSSSSSQEDFDPPSIVSHAETSSSTNMNTLSEKPPLEKILAAVTQARKAGTQALAHLLEHFNKDWLFKLYDKTKSPELLAILGQKIEIRREFERSLTRLSLNATTAQRPSCFICFALEPDVSSWLEKVFVPDLELVDVDPVFCLKQFGPGKELNAFQAMIRTTSKVVVVCTPRLKQFCVERQTSPTGSAQEIRLAKERYNDKEKYETIFPIFLKGERQEVLPDPFFEPILGTVLNQNEDGVLSYYSHAFELFAGIRGVERSEARKIKDGFFNKVETILEEQDFSLDQLQQKSENQDSETAIRVKSISEGVTRKIKKMSLPPYPPNFTGRSEELQRLKKLFQSGARHVAILGPSGIGKSALALAFAHQSKQDFEFIYAITVSEHIPLISGLLKLAEELNFNGTEDQRLVSLKAWLKGADRKHLILLDNMNDPDLFEELNTFFDPSLDCCFLLTSVMTEHSRRLGFELVRIKRFELEDAASFLQQSSFLKDEENAKAVVRALHHSPLALAYAAEYVRRTHVSFTTFLERYQTEGINLLSINLPQGTLTNLTTWKTYLKKIRQKMGDNACATQILAFCSCLADTAITYRTLQKWAEGKYSTLDFDRALGWLLEFGLLESLENDTYRLDPSISIRKQIIENLHLIAKEKITSLAAEFEEHVYFHHNATVVLASKPIKAAIDLMKKSKFVRLIIEGHSDSTEREKEISNERAQNVKNTIVQCIPEFEERIDCMGVGATKPLDRSSTPVHARNRVAIIRLNLEKIVDHDDFFPIDSLPILISAKTSPKEFVPLCTEIPQLKNLLVEAVKIKLYAMNFVQIFYFGPNEKSVKDPTDYEGCETGTEIEKPLLATRNLLLRYPFIHLVIEGHSDDDRGLDQYNAAIHRAQEIWRLLFGYRDCPQIKPFLRQSKEKDVGATKPLDSSEYPTLERNRVAVIRIDIEKSAETYISKLVASITPEVDPVLKDSKTVEAQKNAFSYQLTGNAFSYQGPGNDSLK